MSQRKSIVFFHPDLGIGGAERLVIDAAVGLQELGHKITIFTSHCDPSHCFEEAKDGTLDVRVRGNSIFPATLFGRFKILFTILRHFQLLLWITISGELRNLNPTAFFLDQLSAGIPFLRWRWPNTHILFYCHFPDLLLVQQRQSWLKRLWRIPFDSLEGWSMRGADRVVVNSEFTKGVVELTWKGLGGERGVGVVYPCVSTKGQSGKKGMSGQEDQDEKALDAKLEKYVTREDKETYRCRVSDCTKILEGQALWRKHVDKGHIEWLKGIKQDLDLPSYKEERVEEKPLWGGKKIFLSINRFEKKKNVGLAIKAFAGLSEPERYGSRLVLAGGYDSREHENVSCHSELVALAEKLGLQAATAKNIVSALSIPSEVDVLFLLSVPGQLKSMLLNAASILLYTPSNEHFGIVPLEAMLAGVPVLAANSGGPLETVVDDLTGWLRSPEKVDQWTAILHYVLRASSQSQLERMGTAGRARVVAEFSETKLAHRLDDELENMVKAPRVKVTELQDILLFVGISPVILLVVLTLLKNLGLLPQGIL